LLIPQLDDRPEASEYARRISRASLYMDQLIQDLLAYGRLHHIDLVKMPVDVGSMVDRLLPIIGETLPLGDAQIRVAPNFPRVLAHPALLSQAIENLLVNALKFTRSDVRPEISVYGEERDERVRIIVEDNGVGIDPEYQGKIFGVFQRAHSADEYPGTGIGLAIVKRAVELMDGRVGVESAPGKGSRFWIELPKATEQATDHTRPPAQSQQMTFIPPPSPAPLPHEMGGA
jgi:signal transduction histidine kinase